MSDGYNAIDVTLGTCGGVSVIANVQPDLAPFGAAVSVTLNATYDRSAPTSFPQVAGLTGAAAIDSQSVIASGTTLLFHPCEATALVATGNATLAG